MPWMPMVASFALVEIIRNHDRVSRINNKPDGPLPGKGTMSGKKYLIVFKNGAVFS